MEIMINEYKNIKETMLNIDTNIVFVGQNGAGKTNLMNYLYEAILESDSEQDRVVTYIRANRVIRDVELGNKFKKVEPKLEEINDYEYAFKYQYKSLDTYEAYIKAVISACFDYDEANEALIKIGSTLRKVFNYEINSPFNINDLSDGMKSVICILSQLYLIEFEKENNIKLNYETEETLQEFNEKNLHICLIDEIDLNIYGSNIVRLYECLKEEFPLWTFVITTHSPSLIYNIQEDEKLYSLSDGVLKEEDNYYTKPINDVLSDLFNIGTYNENINTTYKKLKILLINAYNYGITQELRQEFDSLNREVIIKNNILVKYYNLIKSEMEQTNESV